MIVSDHRALFSDYTLNNGVRGVAAFVSFSFANDPKARRFADMSAETMATFRAFTAAEQDLARAAIKAWADACGLTAFEVAPGEGDIDFAVLDLTKLGYASNIAGIGGYPGSWASLGAKSSDVTMGRAFFDRATSGADQKTQVLLHEIGHALGMKHPFEGDTTLDAEHDTKSWTIMSYTGSASKLGAYDIAAAVATYGSAQADGSQVAAWSWDAVARTLTQTGSAGNDVIRGIGGSDVIRGGVGDDSIDVVGGSDVAWGGTGNDRITSVYGAARLYGDDGNDVLRAADRGVMLDGGAGDDTLGLFLNGATIDDPRFMIDGGTGQDMLSLSMSEFDPAFANGFTLSIADQLARGATLSGVESISVYGHGSKANILTGSPVADMFQGGSAADVLRGLDGNDTLTGMDGDDVLDGGAGADRLNGSAGNDRLIGGVGDDTLSGGLGADVVVLVGNGQGADVMFDFSRSEDRFDLGGRSFIAATAARTGGTLLTYAGGTFQVTNLVGLTLAEWNALVLVTPSAVLPVSGAGAVSVMADLTLAFGSAVTRGVGAVTLTRADGTVAERFDMATSTRIAIAGGIVTIDPSRALDAGVRYTLTIAPGALTVGGVGFAGLSNYDFATRAIDTASRFQLLVGDGLAATVSGSGTVFGTRTGPQDVTVANAPGQVTLDPSFNAGGDRIRLSGAAGDYSVQRSGSTVLLSDGDTIVAVPVGPASTDIIFADGIRTLALDTVAGVARIGGQVVSTTANPLGAPAGAATATGVTVAGPGVLLQVDAGASATVFGVATVLGGRDTAESVTVARGATVTFDPSFNAGRDVISLPGDAATYSAVRTGSSILLTSATERVTVPVGVVGATLRFDDAERALVFDPAAQAITLGAQAIGTAAAAVAAPSAQTARALTTNQDAGSGDFRYSHAGDTTPNAVVLGFARGDSLALGGDAARYIFAGDGANLTLSYLRSDGTVTTTTLVGIADPSIYIGDRASAEAAVGFGFIAG